MCSSLFIGPIFYKQMAISSWCVFHVNGNGFFNEVCSIDILAKSYFLFSLKIASGLFVFSFSVT